MRAARVMGVNNGLLRVYGDRITGRFLGTENNRACGTSGGFAGLVITIAPDCQRDAGTFLLSLRDRGMFAHSAMGHRREHAKGRYARAALH